MQGLQTAQLLRMFGIESSYDSKLTGQKLQYIPNHCFMNANHNKKNAYKDLNLKLVFGSLGLNGWFEFGGKDWTMKEWKEARKDKCLWDAHCWLEDDDGNIYDFCFASYLQVSQIRLNTKGSLKVCLLEKVSKEDCERRGLTYVPADSKVQNIIHLDFKLGGLMD